MGDRIQQTGPAGHHPRRVEAAGGGFLWELVTPDGVTLRFGTESAARVYSEEVEKECRHLINLPCGGPGSGQAAARV